MTLEETLNRYPMEAPVREALVEIAGRIKNPDAQNWAVWFVEVDNTYQHGNSSFGLHQWETLSGHTELVFF